MKEIPTYGGRENPGLSKWSPFRLFLGQPVLEEKWKACTIVGLFS